MRQIDFKETKPWSQARLLGLAFYILYIEELTFFFFFFKAIPTAYGSSHARDQIRAKAVTYATDVATLNP